RPVVLDRRNRYSQDLGNFLIGQSCKVPQLYDVGLNRVPESKFVQRFIYGEYLVIRRGRSQIEILQIYASMTAAMTYGLSSPAAIDQNAPHRIRRGAEEMGAIIDRGIARPHQPKPSFVD